MADYVWTTARYLAGPETMQRRELWGGIMRDAPSPLFEHQQIIVRLTVLLDAHARAHNAGVVGVAPLDVVLDEKRALILQPDVMFIARERAHIIRGQVWGPPDLVVEVQSPSSYRYDRGKKRDCYFQYGVREYWLVDPEEHEITVIHTDAAGQRQPRVFRGRQRVSSQVLNGFKRAASSFFN